MKLNYLKTVLCLKLVKMDSIYKIYHIKVKYNVNNVKIIRSVKEDI